MLLTTHRVPSSGERPSERGSGRGRHPAWGTRWAWVLAGLSTTLTISACSAPESSSTQASGASWDSILSEAEGQTVDLWMYGGDEAGNAYVNDLLAPAAAELGVTLRQVPIADTKEAIRRMLAEKQAGRTDGDVDLIWVNGDNFATGRQADAWLCGWSDDLPNATFVGEDDPLVTDDFGTPVDGCEAPWHKAQFTLVYDSAVVDAPPTTFEGVLKWAEANPGQFTYPAPPDFTGSVFLRQALYAQAGGYENVPANFDQAAFDELTPGLWQRLNELEPSLWRQGKTYPKDSVALDNLYANGEVAMTMTYGPATLTELVDNGTFPETTKVLQLEAGTVGNASFLGIPATAADQAGAQVVADLALSVDQQALKADPEVWGQFTVLDVASLPQEDRRRFDELPQSDVVPPYEELARNANPELSSTWVTPLDEGWRSDVLGS